MIYAHPSAGRVLTGYAAAWLFGWPRHPHKMGVHGLDPEIPAEEVRQGLELSPQMLRLAWSRRRDMIARAHHAAAQAVAYTESDGDLGRYRIRLDHGASRDFRVVVLRLRALRFPEMNPQGEISMRTIRRLGRQRIRAAISHG